MAQNQQQEFVSELLNKEDQVVGIWLTINKFLILFLKCLYIRKQKKFITFLELFLPLLIFFFAMYNQDRIFNFRDWKSSKSSAVSGNGLNNIRFLNNPNEPLETPFYFYYSSNVNGSSLEEFLTDALKVK